MRGILEGIWSAGGDGEGGHDGPFWAPCIGVRLGGVEELTAGWERGRFGEVGVFRKEAVSSQGGGIAMMKKEGRVIFRGVRVGARSCLVINVDFYIFGGI